MALQIRAASSQRLFAPYRYGELALCKSYKSMENYLSLVSSRGLLKSCAIHSKAPRSSFPYLDLEPSVIYPGGSIYVCTDALEDFVVRMLPNLQIPFVLVSGDSDRSVNEELISSEHISELLQSPYLIRWFAQNLLTLRPKLHHLPIGLDYHTVWERPGFFECEKMAPLAQEKQLLNTLACSPDLSNRKLLAYCNWGSTVDRGDRKECIERVDLDIVYVETERLPRHTTWRRQSEFVFVLSPSGAGQDCHRTWEAIMTGSVPIVKKSALDPVFEQLPVAIVDDWAQVTRDWLESTLAKFLNVAFDYSPMFLGFWQKKIYGMDPERLHTLTLAQFKQQIK